eukprot:PhM_4_TR15194/c0_g1_i3/m.34958/K04947/KCNT2; potassium channel subfamily T member 2
MSNATSYLSPSSSPPPRSLLEARIENIQLQLNYGKNHEEENDNNNNNIVTNELSYRNRRQRREALLSSTFDILEGAGKRSLHQWVQETTAYVLMNHPLVLTASLIVCITLEIMSLSAYIWATHNEVSWNEDSGTDLDAFDQRRPTFVFQNVLSVIFNVQWVMWVTSSRNAGRLFSFYTLISLLTSIPMNILGIGAFYNGTWSDGLLPMFLRIWWAFYYLHILVNIPDLRVQKHVPVVFVIQMMRFIAVMTTCAGIFQLSQSTTEAHLSFFDATYFTVVTFSTAGYGDITASSRSDRAIVMGFITITVIGVPSVLAQIGEMVALRKRFVSYTPDRVKHILVIGPITRAIMAEVLNEHYSGTRSLNAVNIVFLSPTGYDPETTILARDPFWARRITLIQGEPTNDDDLIRCHAETADAVFVLTDRQQLADRGDFSTLRALQAVSNTGLSDALPAFVVSQRLKSFSDISSQHPNLTMLPVVELRESLLGQSVIVPGIIPLVVNLCRTATLATLSPHTTRWMDEYREGRGNNIYALPCPSYLIGVPFISALLIMKKRINALLLGVAILENNDASVPARRRVVLNPKLYRFEPTDDVLFVAEDEDDFRDLVIDKFDLYDRGQLITAVRSVQESIDYIEAKHETKKDEDKDDDNNNNNSKNSPPPARRRLRRLSLVAAGAAADLLSPTTTTTTTTNASLRFSFTRVVSNLGTQDASGSYILINAHSFMKKEEDANINSPFNLTAHGVEHDNTTSDGHNSSTDDDDDDDDDNEDENFSQNAFRDHVVILDLTSMRDTGDLSVTESSDVVENTNKSFWDVIVKGIKHADAHDRTAVVVVSATWTPSTEFLQMYAASEAVLQPFVLVRGSAAHSDVLNGVCVHTARGIIISSFGGGAASALNDINTAIVHKSVEGILHRSRHLRNNKRLHPPIIVDLDHSTNGVLLQPTHINEIDRRESAQDFTLVPKFIIGEAISASMLDCCLYQSYNNRYLVEVLKALVLGSGPIPPATQHQQQQANAPYGTESLFGSAMTRIACTPLVSLVSEESSLAEVFSEMAYAGRILIALYREITPEDMKPLKKKERSKTPKLPTVVGAGSDSHTVDGYNVDLGDILGKTASSGLAELEMELERAKTEHRSLLGSRYVIVNPNVLKGRVLPSDIAFYLN